MEKPTIQELEMLMNVKLEEERRVKLAIELGICPVCGANLIRKDNEILDKPIKFLGITIRKEIVWNKRIVCSSDKSHYEFKEDFPYEPF